MTSGLADRNPLITGLSPLLSVSVAAVVSAQQPNPQREVTPERRAQRELAEVMAQMRPETAGRCALPDGSTRLVNTTATVNGWTYRCAAIYDEALKPKGTAWTVVPAVEQAPLRR